MKIAAAQLDCRVGDVAANVDAIVARVTAAADAGCDLVVLPEMADTGYDMDAIRRCAAVWDGPDDGRSPCAVLCRAARERGVAVICGLSEREGDSVYNAVAAIDSSGRLVGRYRKAHLFSYAPVCEDKHLSRGDEATVINLCGFRVGIMVCYDLRFPEWARLYALRGAEVLVVPAAWPFPRIEHWKLLTSCRAVENQVFVAAANRVGSDGCGVFCGSSRVLDPFGTILASAPETDECMIIARLGRERLDKVRSSMRVFADRRPDLYDAGRDDRP